jgi:site-specific DNA-methyltransferase (adenine-specific)
MNLILGDCYSEPKNLPKNSVDLILIDPPYNISRNTNFNKGGGNESKYGILQVYKKFNS